MKQLLLALPALLTSLLCACVVCVGQSSCRNTVHGSGTAAVEARGVGDFSRIEVGSTAHVTASTGPETSVIVHWDDNLVPYVRTELRGDTLVVDLVDGSYSSKSDPEIEIVTARIEGVTVSGAGHAEVRGVDVDRFEAHVSGAGDMRVAGRADAVTARVSGAGDLDLSELTARTGDVEVSGAGDLEINARENLVARVSGAGDVHYSGDPSVSKTVSGAGSVNRR